MKIFFLKYHRLLLHHFLMLYALYHWPTFTLTFGLIGAIIVSHKIGHLYIGHNQNSASFVHRVLSLIYVCALGQGSPMQMAYIHRLHHIHSDTEKDPHSPKFLGRWNVYFLNWKTGIIQKKILKDYIGDNFQSFLNRWYISCHWIFCLFVYVIGDFFLLSTCISSVVVISFHYQSITNTFSHNESGPINNYSIKYVMPWGYKHKDHHETIFKS